MAAEKIFFRVSQEEKQAIQRMAAAAGMSVSEFTRQRIFSSDGGSGGNAGQIAALAQQAEAMQTQLAELLQKLIAFERFTGSLVATHYVEEHPDGIDVVRNFQREFGISEEVKSDE